MMAAMPRNHIGEHEDRDLIEPETGDLLEEMIAPLSEHAQPKRLGQLSLTVAGSALTVIIGGAAWFAAGGAVAALVVPAAALGAAGLAGGFLWEAAKTTDQFKRFVDHVANRIGGVEDAYLQGTRRLVAPPGSMMRSTLAFIFSNKAFDNVFAQAIIDMREEHAGALSEGHIWKARWIVLRDHFGLCLTIGTYLSTSVVKKATAVWKLIP